MIFFRNIFFLHFRTHFFEYLFLLLFSIRFFLLFVLNVSFKILWLCKIAMMMRFMRWILGGFLTRIILIESGEFSSYPGIFLTISDNFYLTRPFFVLSKKSLPFSQIFHLFWKILIKLNNYIWIVFIYFEN